MKLDLVKLFLRAIDKVKGFGNIKIKGDIKVEFLLNAPYKGYAILYYKGQIATFAFVKPNGEINYTTITDRHAFLSLLQAGNSIPLKRSVGMYVVDNGKVQPKNVNIGADPNMSESVLYESLTTKKEDLPDVQTGEAFKVTFYDNGEYVGEASVSDDYDGDKLCFAYNIEVKKDLRGQGYGTKIMKHMIDKYHVKSLQVAPDNDVAIHLYKKLGFKKTGEVRMSKTRVDDRMELPSKKRLDEEICYEQTLNEDLRTFMISNLPDKMIN